MSSGRSQGCDAIVVVAVGQDAAALYSLRRVGIGRYDRRKSMTNELDAAHAKIEQYAMDRTKDGSVMGYGVQPDGRVVIIIRRGTRDTFPDTIEGIVIDYHESSGIFAN
jgi:hypothetical protein